MDRREKLLDGIDVSQILSVEIGALCFPLIRREDGRVIYVDHDDQAALKQHYANDSNVDVESIVHVDVVWGGRPLSELMPEPAQCIVASHVVEHVPNLIGWLRELKSILSSDGEIRLIVPDKRFTFDFVRSETRIADVAYADLMDARVPLPHQVLEYVANVTKVDSIAAWSSHLSAGQLDRHHSLEHAINCARQSSQGVYHDIHCWVFTPASFALLMADLCAHGLANFECSMFHDTEPFTIEFFVGLRWCEDRARAIASWQAAAARC